MSNPKADIAVITVNDIDAAPVSLPPPAKTDYEAGYHKLMERLTDVADEKLRLQEENSKLKRLNATHEVLNRLIEPSATKAFSFMRMYSGAVGVLLVLSGFSVFGFSLPEQVLVYLVGSTAATVIGLVGMVLTGVFIGARKH